jgi:hypothetical protein
MQTNFRDRTLARMLHEEMRAGSNRGPQGINNKIKVLKRRSYGFHDEQYFFLKILSATGALPCLEQLSDPRF